MVLRAKLPCSNGNVILVFAFGENEQFTISKPKRLDNWTWEHDALGKEDSAVLYIHLVAWIEVATGSDPVTISCILDILRYSAKNRQYDPIQEFSFPIFAQFHLHMKTSDTFLKEKLIPTFVKFIEK